MAYTKTLSRREALPHGAPESSHPACGPSRLQLVERGAARRGTRRPGHRLSHAHSPRRHLRPRERGIHVHPRRQRSAQQIPHGAGHRRHRRLQGPHLLHPQHQHLPRPPLGTRHGDLRRGPLPHRPDGPRLRERLAACVGRELCGQSAHHRRLPQALRRPQRSRGHSPRV